MPIGSNLPARLAEWDGVGTTYYVDDAIGNDSNTETQAKSEATPWKTIMKAVNTMVIPAAGHVRILVKNGTYRATGNSNAVQATVNFFSLGVRTPSADHVLIIENYPGHAPVVVEPAYTGASPTTSERHAFWFDDASAHHIRIRGLEVRPFDVNGVALNQAQGFRIDATTADVEIDNCHIHGWKVTGGGTNPRAQGIFISNGAQRVHVYDSVVHDIGDGITGASNLEHGLYIGGSAHVVANVLAYDCRNGFGIQFYEGGGGGTGHVVTHVVTANNKKSGLVVDGTFGVDVRNSIFYDNDEWGVSARGSATVTVQYCLSNANGLAGNQGSGYNTEGTATITRSNNLTSAPAFVNYAGRNFHLDFGSPAYDAGVEEFTTPTDLEGETRIAYTLGVYLAPEESFTAEGDYPTLLNVYVGMAFGYDPYDTDPVYTDVSGRLLSFDFERGRRTVFDAIDPARLTLELSNQDRALDPHYLGSPYAGNVLPGVRVVIEIEGTRVYSGFVEGWPQNWEGRRNQVSVTALDLFDTFNVDMIPGTVYGVQKSGARIVAGLAEIGVPAAWYTGVQTGIDDIQTHTAGEEDNWLEHFKDVARTEQGYLFQDRLGDIRFYQRHTLSLPPFTDVQMILSNDPGFGERPVSDVNDPDYSVADIRNDVRVSRQGGATTRVVDSASVTKYRKRTYQVTTLHESTTVPADLATWILGLYSEPRLRPDGVTLEPQMDAQMLFPTITRELGDRVRLKVQPPGPVGVIDLEAAIQSIGMSMGEDRKLVVKWNLAPPTGASQVWKLGTHTLGVDTYLGF